MTLNRKNKGFQWIFREFRLRLIFQQWMAPKLLEIDQDNLHMKYSALNLDFNSARFEPLPIGLRSPLYECIKCGYPLQCARFLLLSTNLARERLQIDTDLLLIITSTADELSRGTNIDDLERPWNPNIAGFSEFFTISGCDTHLKSEFSLKLLEIDQDDLHMKLNWCCRASHED